MRSTLFFALCLSGCVGTTGGELFEIETYASGPTDLVDGEPYDFVNGRGFSVTLDQARLHVGAMYLNRTRSISVSSDTSCILPGIYVAEVTSGLDVDLLSPALQKFPGRAVASDDAALAGEVWLSAGDVNAASSNAVVLAATGEARRDALRYPFSARLTIGQNRAIPPENPALPGANPICKQRIVSPVPVDLALDPGDALILRVDPARFFANVDFSTLEPDPSDPARFEFSDSQHANQASDSLYAGLRGTLGYRFEIDPETPRP